MRLTFLTAFIVFQIVVMTGLTVFGYQSFMVNRRICQVKFPSINTNDCAFTLHKLEYIAVTQGD